jgi:phenylpropionate dioxygenase-like ring-hydroxylating dioxygenase large terminal subunit
MESRQEGLWLRDYWYIACASLRLRSAPLTARVLNQDLVLFRDGSGKAHALIDRCCHRGVRLSLGTVTDGALACGYHGWRYDGTGRCIHIPSLTAGRHIPRGCEVQAFPCLERDSYVWVWMGESGSQPAPLPGIPEFQRHRWRQGSLAMQCEAIKMIENNLDWCHPYFAHPWTHGQFFATRFRGFKEQSYEMRITERGMVVFAPVTAAEEDPIPERPIVLLTFELPDRVRVEFWRPFHVIIWMHFVPTGVNTCRLEWLNTKLLSLGSRASWCHNEPRIFKQDRRLLESAQPAYDREGSGFECSVEADASTLMVRRIVALAMRKEWEQARSSLSRRRVIHVRT